MEQNRRRFLRKVPTDPAFIQIERDEVGKVLNVSEGGLSFSSVTPVPRNLPVYFWFSFNLKDQIEAMGEVAWTDLSRTVGGLRFTQLSQGSREQIQKWLSRLRTEEAAREVPKEVEVAEGIPEEEQALVPQLVAAMPNRANEAIPQPIPIKTRERKAGEPDRVARFVSKVRGYRPHLPFQGRTAEGAKGAQPPALAMAPPAPPPPALTNEPVEPPKTRPGRSMFSLETGATQGPEPGDSKSSSLSFKGIESLVELVPVQRYLSAKKRQLLCGVILGICMSAAVMLLVLKFWSYRTHAAMIKPAGTESSGLRNNVPSEPADPSSSTLPAAKPSYPVAGVFSDPAPIPFKNKKAATPNLVAKSQAADPFWDKPRTVAAKGTKQSAGASAPSASNTASTGSKKSGMTPNELWGEVQAGNSKAAVELAELYIKGDGVPQNCKQARVLLLVASEKRNTAAIKRLQQLDKGAACQ